MIYIENQFSVFLLSILFGVFLSLIYELFCSLGLLLNLRRAVINKKKIVFLTPRKAGKWLLAVWDVLYFILIAPLVAIFLYIVNFGILRWYIAVGAIIGFTLSKITICKLVGHILNLSILMLKRHFLGKIINLMEKAIIKLKKVKMKKVKKAKKEQPRTTIFSINVKQG